MSIHTLVDRLCSRLHDAPQYPTQGATLFVDLERKETRRKYLPAEVLTHFLGGRGANMWLLYNLLQEDKDALDPEVPLIFGAGVLTSVMPSATRGNFTSVARVLRHPRRQRRRLLPLLPQAPRLRPPGALRQGRAVDPAAHRPTAMSPSRTPPPTPASTTSTRRRPASATSNARSARTWRSPASPAPARTACSAPASWAASRPSGCAAELLPVEMITLAIAALDGREAGRFEQVTKVTATE